MFPDDVDRTFILGPANGVDKGLTQAEQAFEAFVPFFASGFSQGRFSGTADP